MKQSLITLKKQFKKEIIIVFGCGGERDKKKRFAMGKIASKYCRKIFVTDDNPRNENPKKIRNTIIKGCKKIAVNIGSRKKAIKTAISELGSNEILLVAGKGNEETQDLGNKIVDGAQGLASDIVGLALPKKALKAAEDDNDETP